MLGDQGYSENQLEAAIWYVKHRAILRKIVLGFIVVVDGLLILYAGFGVGRDIFSFRNRRTQELELLRSVIPIGPMQTAVRPQDLQLGGVELIRSGAVVDVLARVQNPNPDWYVRFEYAIGLGENVERVKDGFLLPGEERPLFRSIRGSGSSGTLVFNIENVSWRRVNFHDISDFTSWRGERMNFEIKDARFFPAVLEGKGSVSRAKFTITNRTAYSYVAPKFLVLLYQGSRLVGIQSTVLDQFKTGQLREVELSWFDRVGAVSNVEVIPEIDIMDEGVYLKP